jgi:hypothetical protein
LGRAIFKRRIVRPWRRFKRNPTVRKTAREVGIRAGLLGVGAAFLFLGLNASERGDHITGSSLTASGLTTGVQALALRPMDSETPGVALATGVAMGGSRWILGQVLSIENPSASPVSDEAMVGYLGAFGMALSGFVGAMNANLIDGPISLIGKGVHRMRRFTSDIRPWFASLPEKIRRKSNVHQTP